MLGKKSKLTQFIGLVDMAESGGGERKTTAQDLMVCMSLLRCTVEHRALALVGERGGHKRQFQYWYRGRPEGK